MSAVVTISRGSESEVWKIKSPADASRVIQSSLETIADWDKDEPIYSVIPAIEELAFSLNVIRSGEKSVKIRKTDVKTPLKKLKLLLIKLESIVDFDDERCNLIMDCLAGIININLNSESNGILEHIIGESAWYDYITRWMVRCMAHCAEAPSAKMFETTEKCLHFGIQFCRSNSIRQMMFAHTPGMVQAAVELLDVKHPGPFIGSLLTLFINLLGRSINEDPHGPKVFIESGGYERVQAVFYHYCAIIGAYPSDMEMRCLGAFASANAALDELARNQSFEITDALINESVVAKNARIVFQYLSKTSVDSNLCNMAIVLALNLAQVIQRKPGDVSALLELLFLFFHSSSSGNSGTPLVLQLIRLSRHPNFAPLSEQIWDVIGIVGATCPNVDALVDQELDKTFNCRADIEVAEMKTCSYPGCAIGSLLGEKNASKLRLCSGCLQVRYCSKEHQQAHWKAHKSMCNRSTMK